MKLKKDIFNFKSQFYNGRRVLSSIPPPLSADPSITEGIFLLNIMSKALTYGGDGGGRGGGEFSQSGRKIPKCFPPSGKYHFSPLLSAPGAPKSRRSEEKHFWHFFLLIVFFLYNFFERRRKSLLANKESDWLVCLLQTASCDGHKLSDVSSILATTIKKSA